jgi:hypothetical protein
MKPIVLTLPVCCAVLFNNKFRNFLFLVLKILFLFEKGSFYFFEEKGYFKDIIGTYPLYSTRIKYLFNMKIKKNIYFFIIIIFLTKQKNKKFKTLFW